MRSRNRGRCTTRNGLSGQMRKTGCEVACRRFQAISPVPALAVLVLAVGAGLLALTASCTGGPDGEHAAHKAEKTLYTCPMHPEVISEKKDDRCPQCNMFLVPKGGKATAEPAKGHEEHKTREGQPKKAAGPRKQMYHCPMHPTYTSDRKGECPICGMDLVPIEEAEELESSVSGQATVRINPVRQQLIGMKTAAVEKKSLTKVVRTVGHIAYDPELFAAQEEYLTARTAYGKIRGSSTPDVAARAKSLVSSSRLRLRLLGLSEDQIKKLEVNGGPDANLLIGQGGEDRVWLYADIYEFEFGHIRPGQAVVASTLAYAGQKFKGEVVAIDPLVNPRTRSTRLRAHLDNPKGLLKPDMFMKVKVFVDLGTGLVVPESAVMFTGDRVIVFLDDGEGRFQPRELALGVKIEDYYQVKSGLKEGDVVVTSGNFLVDAESKLKAAISQMTAGKHQH